jgi:hypothetical protein
VGPSPGGIIVTGLLGYVGYSLYENKQEPERVRADQEVQERIAQQEEQARRIAEQQAQAER